MRQQTAREAVGLKVTILRKPEYGDLTVPVGTDSIWLRSHVLIQKVLEDISEN